MALTMIVLLAMGSPFSLSVLGRAATTAAERQGRERRAEREYDLRKRP
jgi:hypothetical protein